MYAWSRCAWFISIGTSVVTTLGQRVSSEWSAGFRYKPGTKQFFALWTLKETNIQEWDGDAVKAHLSLPALRRARLGRFPLFPYWALLLNWNLFICACIFLCMLHFSLIRTLFHFSTHRSQFLTEQVSDFWKYKALNQRQIIFLKCLETVTPSASVCWAWAWLSPSIVSILAFPSSLTALPAFLGRPCSCTALQVLPHRSMLLKSESFRNHSESELKSVLCCSV